jgi:putative peptidoglycan lipid II flippase
VKDILKHINKSRTLGVAAFLISFSYLLSRILGLVRDRLLASNFGVSAQTDAYTAAFRIPDLLFTLLVSGAFAVSFIPVFIGYLEKKKTDEAWQVTSSLLNIFSVATIVLCALAFIFAPQLVRLLAPGFDTERTTLTINITRIMLVTPFMFSISSVLGAVQQAFNRFTLFAMASVFYNVGIIIGIVYFSKFFPNQPIYGVAWGVVFGATLQTLLQFLGIIGLHFRYRFSFKLFHPGVLRVIKLMIPRSLDLAIDQFNWIIQTIIGSRLAAGSLASYYYANNLKNVPLGIFGMAISTAVFPSLIRAAKSKNKSSLPKAIVRDMCLIMFFVIPSAAFTIVMRGYIVRLLFGFGDQATADTLGWLAGSIIATSLFFMIARVFYSLEDTLTPLLTSLSSIVINIILSIYLSSKYGVSGMGLALTIATFYELILLMFLLRRKIGNYGYASIIKTAIKLTVASAAMTIALYLLVNRFLPLYKVDVGFMSLAPKFTAISIAGLAIFFIGAKLLKVHEAEVVLKRVLHPIRVLKRVGKNG